MPAKFFQVEEHFSLVSNKISIEKEFSLQIQYKACAQMAMQRKLLNMIVSLLNWFCGINAMTSALKSSSILKFLLQFVGEFFPGSILTTSPLYYL